jgi:hypothetical protein
MTKQDRADEKAMVETIERAWGTFERGALSDAQIVLGDALAAHPAWGAALLAAELDMVAQSEGFEDHVAMQAAKTDKQWTAQVVWPSGESELVDVAASNEAEAAREVQRVLDADYEPGGKIRHIQPAAAAFQGGSL